MVIFVWRYWHAAICTDACCKGELQRFTSIIIQMFKLQEIHRTDFMQLYGVMRKCTTHIEVQKIWNTVHAAHAYTCKIITLYYYILYIYARLCTVPQNLWNYQTNKNSCKNVASLWSLKNINWKSNLNKF